MPPMVIADLGAGEGTFLTCSRNALKVIAVDNSANMIEVGRERRAAWLENIEFRLGDMEEVPIEDAASIWCSFRSRCIMRCTPSALFLRPGEFCSPAAAS